MTDDVRKQSAEAAALCADAELVDALLGGTKTMRAAGEKYLPKWPNEDADAHKARLAVATLFPAFPRTVEILASKPFSKALSLSEDVPEKIKTICDDIDLQGRDLHSFGSALCEAAIAHGFRGILVDGPVTRDKDGKQLLVTVADEKAAGLRPHFVEIRATQILGWLPKNGSLNAGLTQLRLLESYSEPNGVFDTVEREQVRVLTIGGWAIWRKKSVNGKDSWYEHDKGPTTFKTIPFVACYGKRTGFMAAKPPMLELCHANVEHWQTKSDRQNALHVLSVPILFTKMLGKSVITVGTGSAVKAESPDADMKFVEMDGAAVEAGRKVLTDLEDQMRQAGAELLVVTPGNKTEIQTTADNEQGACTLHKIAKNLEDALNQALQLAAEWMGEASGGHCSVYRDFGAATLAEASAELLLKTAQAGKMSDESLFDEYKRRGLRAPEATWEQEQERLTAQGPVLAEV
jgi:hypothetical protein